VALILSDSTERWDVAGIADDKAVLHAFGNEALGIDYKSTRLAYHMDRVGIYYALVHGSRSPDLLIEEDVIDGRLKDFEVAYWVGDCADPRVVKAIETWVSQGGRLLATAGAFRLNPYRRPLPEGMALLGLTSATLDEKQTFFRPQIELPNMAPLDTVGAMPVFGVIDRAVVGPETEVVAAFESGTPAVIERRLGKGTITYVAALPGVTYLWSAMQPPQPPPRGVWSHVTLTDFNPEAGRLILAPAKPVVPRVDAGDGRLDARLLQSPKGFALPVANYAADVDKPVALTLRGLPPVRKITSANRGKLRFRKHEDGAVTVTYSTGLGDILRIDTE